jgi:hypothetical protein
MNDTPIPKLMRTLGLDRRGYPVPWTVLRDKDGQPMFTVNDTRRVHDCIRKKLCAICGKRLVKEEFWWIGGSRVFLHARGAFLDPPLHCECATYALTVCPFLAARYWVDRADPDRLARRTEATLTAHAYLPPALPERFGLGMTDGYRVTLNDRKLYLLPNPWRYVEFWRAGEPCPAPGSAEPVPVPPLAAGPA